MPESPYILVVEDHADFLATLLEWLEGLGYRAHGVSTGREAAAAVRSGAFDLVLTDLHLPDLDGLDVLTLVKDLAPDLEVIVLTGRPTLEAAIGALRARAFDFFEKPLGGGMKPLQLAIERALGRGRGRRVSAPLSTAGPLSEREREVLALVAEGLENKAIARRLGLSERTVRNHMSSVFSKLGVSNRTQAVLRAQQHGLLP